MKVAREEACKVYLAPEIVSAVNPSPTGPADVFSYAVILFEIATRIDVYSVCDTYCTYVTLPHLRPNSVRINVIFGCGMLMR